MDEAPPHRPGRNEPCHCGSGKKYKHCCLVKDEEADRALRAEHASAAPAAAEPADEASPHQAPPPRPPQQPWKRVSRNAVPGRRITTPRKAG